MKFATFALCCALIILEQNVDSLPKRKPPQLSNIIALQEENEENDKDNYLLDLMEKGLDEQEDISIFMTTPVRAKAKKKIAIDQKKQIEQEPPKKLIGKETSVTKSKKSRKSMNTYRSNSAHSEDDIDTSFQSKTNQNNMLAHKTKGSDEKEKHFVDTKRPAAKERIQKNGIVNRGAEDAENIVQGIHRRGSNVFLEPVHNVVVGSVEDETLEEDIDEGGRRAIPDRKFATVYRYENEPLKNMLVWLVMNSQNPAIKNAIKASKTQIDRYVKHTVDKAAGQASLRYADYSSVRFDKDRIVMYCGGEMYVYNTLKDSKICFNGQVQEVRLI